MANELRISGKNMLLFLGEDPNNLNTVVCLTSNSISRTTAEIDAATKCGPNKSIGDKSNAVTFEGEIVPDPETGSTSLEDMINWWTNDTIIYWRMAMAIPTTGTPIHTGTAFISQLDETYSKDGNGTFTGALGVQGIIDTSFANS